MPSYAALDVSQETTAICVVDEASRILAEKKVATCPDAITSYLTQRRRTSFGSGLRLDRWPYGFGTSWLRVVLQSCASMPGMPTQL